MANQNQMYLDKDVEVILKDIENLNMFKDLDIKLLANEKKYTNTLTHKLRYMKTT